MKALNVVPLGLLCLILISNSCVVAQDDPTADASEEGSGGDEKSEEECEEAWDYVEFLKTDIKEELESILQETLFEKKPLLEQTVTETVEKVLKVRDAILARTKAIRTNDGSVTICEEQNIKQEEFLTQVRMEIMTVLLSLIEKDAASAENLQDIGRSLLAIRTKVNGEITRMIMLRSSSGPTIKSGGECDCGILGELVNDLDKVIDGGKGGEDDAEVTEDDSSTDAPSGGDEGDEEGGNNENVVQDLTETLMKVDSEIRGLYNSILSELDEMKREELSKQLLDLKPISTDLHAAISKLVELDPEEDADSIKRFIKRDIRTLRNSADRLLKTCQEKCPSECDSCGSEKILELEQKLEDYKISLEELEEGDSLEQIRSDLMTYLSSASSEMTELLKTKAEDGELEQCDAEKLEVINKIKGPLWMMVNVTIFGDASTASEMISALETVLEELRSGYCSPGVRIIEEPDTDDCDIQEIETARNWIIDIDTIISDNLFKSSEDDSRKNAMLGFIDLKSSMDDRVRKLFQNRLRCSEEVEQIKNIYSQQLTECLAELMNPRLRFEELDRSKKVQCIKQLRVTIENRRGELLFREIEKKISEAPPGDDAAPLAL